MTIPGGAPALFFTAAAGAAEDFEINRSLRFNSADSAYLSRDFSTGNRKTWTWSGWVKRSTAGSDKKSLFGGSGTNSMIRFNNDDGGSNLRVLDAASGGYDVITKRKFRDLSSWYHIVVALDTTQSTAADRLKIYVNGVQETIFYSASYPTQNQDLTFNNNISHSIGIAPGSVYFDGYMANVQFIDGQALAPTDFGKTDSNGVWQPKAYSGSYGTNGFYLKFADNSSNAALGTDSSGNSNTWTVNNLTASTGDTTPSEHFAVVTYTGNGGTQSISSLSFSPDFLWLKRRNGNNAHVLFDQIRGVTKALESSNDGAEKTNDPSIASFDANGFTVSGTSNQTNNSGQTYVAWAWNAGANSNKTYTVKVVSDSGNKYRFDDYGVSAVTLELAEGSTYVFDQSDSSNSGHPLRFSTTSNGTHGGGSEYTTGVTTTGTPGSAGAKTTIVVASGAPTLYYYCTQHSGMGGQANTNATAGSSNFDGSTQAVVKANQAKGFSVVKWSGTNSGTTLGHGLGATPDWVIVKSLGNAREWVVWHSSFGTASNTDYIYLDTTGPKGGSGPGGYWNATAPTTTTFSVGDSAAVNGSGSDYIAYLWSEVAGKSKFGSYTGNGSTSGPTITTGFKPKYLLIKATSISGEDWVIMDTTRDSGNPVDQILFANGSDVEYTNSAYNTEFQATGFQLQNTNPRFNQNGVTYIYMAFADNLGGEGCDSLVDTPEQRADQTDDGAGGNVVGNYAVLNSLNAGSTLSNGNLDVTTPSSGYGLTYGTIGVSSGKWYFEMSPTSVTGNVEFGIAKAGGSLSAALGTLSSGYSYLNTSLKSNNSNYVSYGSSYTTGDVIGIALDLDDGTLIFYKNGVSQGTAYTGLSGEFFPAASDSSGSQSSSLFANFGQRPFAHAAPSGYKTLNTANLPTPTIAAGNQYFDVALWTGTGATRSITGLGFSPDFVWIKKRSGSTAHNLFDNVRGANKPLFANLNNAELSDGRLTSFNSDGFTLDSDNAVNDNNQTHVGWAWDAGSSTVTNTDGSISSQVSANPTAGFSIVKYAGSGSSGTVGHSLNATPHFIILKEIDGAENWRVHHASVEFSKTLFLNLNNAASTNSERISATSASTFTLSSGGAGVNSSSKNYLALCFAPVAGYSMFGSYVGNGTTDNTFVHTGFRPKFLFLKYSSSAGDWMLLDTSRRPNGPSGGTLVANVSNAEDGYYTNTQANIDFLSNGFKPRITGSPFGDSGRTIIFAAFAEHPFKTARAV